MEYLGAMNDQAEENRRWWERVMRGMGGQRDKKDKKDKDAKKKGGPLIVYDPFNRLKSGPRAPMPFYRPVYSSGPMARPMASSYKGPLTAPVGPKGRPMNRVQGTRFNSALHAAQVRASKMAQLRAQLPMAEEFARRNPIGRSYAEALRRRLGRGASPAATGRHVYRLPDAARVSGPSRSVVSPGLDLYSQYEQRAVNREISKLEDSVAHEMSSPSKPSHVPVPRLDPHARSASMSGYALGPVYGKDETDSASWIVLGMSALAALVFVQSRKRSN